MYPVYPHTQRGTKLELVAGCPITVRGVHAAGIFHPDLLVAAITPSSREEGLSEQEQAMQHQDVFLEICWIGMCRHQTHVKVLFGDMLDWNV